MIRWMMLTMSVTPATIEMNMSEFKSWEDMSELEQAQCTFWDLYKDVHGFRPRSIDTSSWTLEDFMTEFKTLVAQLEVNEERRKQDELEAIACFEARIVQLSEVGAESREDAMRWIHQAEESNGDDEYLAYLLKLPYGYFKKVN